MFYKATSSLFSIFSLSVSKRMTKRRAGFYSRRRMKAKTMMSMEVFYLKRMKMVAKIMMRMMVVFYLRRRMIQVQMKLVRN
jgi:hypothetical protein